MPIVLTFVSQKGGVGKSTLARSTAVALARAKINVMLGDCDPQQNTTLRWSDVRKKEKRTPNLAVMSADTAAEILERGKAFEVVVLDMPGRADRLTLDAARNAHVIVQPTGPTLDDLHPSVLLFHELTAAGILKRRLAFVLCRTLTRAEEDAAREYLEHTGYDVLTGSIPEKIGYREALNHGAAAIETEEQALNARAASVVDAILRRVNEEVDELARQNAAAREGKINR